MNPSRSNVFWRANEALELESRVNPGFLRHWPVFKRSAAVALTNLPKAVYLSSNPAKPQTKPPVD